MLPTQQQLLGQTRQQLLPYNTNKTTQNTPSWCSQSSVVVLKSALLTCGSLLIWPTLLGISAKTMFSTHYLNCTFQESGTDWVGAIGISTAALLMLISWAFSAIRQGFEVFSSKEELSNSNWVGAAVLSLITLMGDLPLLGAVTINSDFYWAAAGAFLMNIADNAYHLKMTRDLFAGKSWSEIGTIVTNHKLAMLTGGLAHCVDDIIALVIQSQLQPGGPLFWATLSSTIIEFFISMPEQITDIEDGHGHDHGHGHGHDHGHQHDHGHEHSHHHCHIPIFFFALITNLVRGFNCIVSLENNEPTSSNCSVINAARNKQLHRFSDNLINLPGISCATLALCIIAVYFNNIQATHSFAHYIATQNEEKEEAEAEAETISGRYSNPTGPP